MGGSGHTPLIGGFNSNDNPSNVTGRFQESPNRIFSGNHSSATNDTTVNSEPYNVAHNRAADQAYTKIGASPAKIRHPHSNLYWTLWTLFSAYLIVAVIAIAFLMVNWQLCLFESMEHVVRIRNIDQPLSTMMTYTTSEDSVDNISLNSNSATKSFFGIYKNISPELENTINMRYSGKNSEDVLVDLKITDLPRSIRVAIEKNSKISTAKKYQDFITYRNPTPSMLEYIDKKAQIRKEYESKPTHSTVEVIKYRINSPLFNQFIDGLVASTKRTSSSFEHVAKVMSYKAKKALLKSSPQLQTQTINNEVTNNLKAGSGDTEMDRQPTRFVMSLVLTNNIVNQANMKPIHLKSSVHRSKAIVNSLGSSSSEVKDTTNNHDGPHIADNNNKTTENILDENPINFSFQSDETLKNNEDPVPPYKMSFSDFEREVPEIKAPLYIAKMEDLQFTNCTPGYDDGGAVLDLIVSNPTRKIIELPSPWFNHSYWINPRNLRQETQPDYPYDSTTAEYMMYQPLTSYDMCSAFDPNTAIFPSNLPHSNVPSYIADLTSAGKGRLKGSRCTSDYEGKIKLNEVFCISPLIIYDMMFRTVSFDQVTMNGLIIPDFRFRAAIGPNKQNSKASLSISSSTPTRYQKMYADRLNEEDILKLIDDNNPKDAIDYVKLSFEDATVNGTILLTSLNTGIFFSLRQQTTSNAFVKLAVGEENQFCAFSNTHDDEDTTYINYNENTDGTSNKSDTMQTVKNKCYYKFTGISGTEMLSDNDNNNSTDNNGEQKASTKSYKFSDYDVPLTYYSKDVFFKFEVLEAKPPEATIIPATADDSEQVDYDLYVHFVKNASKKLIYMIIEDVEAGKFIYVSIKIAWPYPESSTYGISTAIDETTVRFVKYHTEKDAEDPSYIREYCEFEFNSSPDNQENLGSDVTYTTAKCKISIFKEDLLVSYVKAYSAI